MIRCDLTFEPCGGPPPFKNASRLHSLILILTITCMWVLCLSHFIHIPLSMAGQASKQWQIKTKGYNLQVIIVITESKMKLMKIPAGPIHWKCGAFSRNLSPNMHH